MSIGTKFLIGAGSLLATVILLYVGFSILGRGKTVSDIVTESQDKGIAQAKEYGLLMYDGYTINGSTAINYIKTAVTDYEVVAYIKKDNGGSISTGTIQYTSDFIFMRDVTQPETYINPLKEYKCTVSRDVNGAFSSIEIEEQ